MEIPLRATIWPRRDPLVLDLNGNRVETTSSRDGKVVLFDHDNDVIKTGTGCVKPSDGWLVMERNANATIDSGRELFGVDTIKTDGTHPAGSRINRYVTNYPLARYEKAGFPLDQKIQSGGSYRRQHTPESSFFQGFAEPNPEESVFKGVKKTCVLIHFPRLFSLCLPPWRRHRF